MSVLPQRRPSSAALRARCRDLRLRAARTTPYTTDELIQAATVFTFPAPVEDATAFAYRARYGRMPGLRVVYSPQEDAWAIHGTSGFWCPTEGWSGVWTSLGSRERALAWLPAALLEFGAALDRHYGYDTTAEV